MLTATVCGQRNAVFTGDDYAGRRVSLFEFILCKSSISSNTVNAYFGLFMPPLAIVVCSIFVNVTSGEIWKEFLLLVLVLF